MIAYFNTLLAKAIPSVDTREAQKIVEEFRRIEQSLASVRDDLLASKRHRSFVVQLRNGDTASSTTNLIEPDTFGAAGMLLQRFRSVYLDAIKREGRIIRLRLQATVTASNSVAANDTFIKACVRLNTTTLVRISPKQTVTGTTPTLLRFDYDLMPYVDEFVNGDCFGAFAVWGSAAGTSTIGAGSVSNPNPSLEIYGEVEEP